jgi:hypothetical protein
MNEDYKMRLPFLKDNTKNPEQKRFHKVIQNEVWAITKLVTFRKLTQKHVDKLEKLYKSYFEKFPDVKGEANSIERIKQLRTFAK